MQESDRPPSPDTSHHDSCISLTPSTESNPSTPATPVDTPASKYESGIESAHGDGHDDRDHDHEGTATPRRPPARSESDRMEEQLRKLQDKLAQLERQTDDERQARQRMEIELMGGLNPMASVALTEAVTANPSTVFGPPQFGQQSYQNPFAPQPYSFGPSFPPPPPPQHYSNPFSQQPYTHVAQQPYPHVTQPFPPQAGQGFYAQPGQQFYPQPGQQFYPQAGLGPLGDNPLVGRYTAVTVSLLESQLTRLKRDLNSINQLKQERDQLVGMQRIREREYEEMKEQLQLQLQQQQQQQQQAAQSGAGGQPTTNVADPTVDVADPIADTADPTVDVADPTADVVDPSDNIDHIPDWVDPTVNAADPAVNVADPTDDEADSTGLPADGSSLVSAVSFEKPILNYVTWEDWRLSYLVPRGDSCAIDVLDGEPDISFERPVLYNYWEPARTAKGAVAAKQRSNIAPKANLGAVPGQGSIPERIRINSRHILSILSEIHKDDIIEGDGPLVMIRPYKGLNYYDKAIRAKLMELEAEFGAKDERPPLSTAAAETISDEVDTLPANAASAAASKDGGPKPKEDKDEWTFSLTAYEHLKCLVQFMDEQIEKKINYLETGQFTRIPFTDIWYLFRPGVEVVDQTLRQAYRVVHVSSPGHTVFPPWRTRWDKEAKAKEETPVILVCVYIDFDGKNFGPSIRRVRIPRYDKEKAVTSLEVFPLRFAEQRTVALAHAASSMEGGGQAKMPLRDKLIARGKLFMDMNMVGFKHMHYNGLTLDTRDEVDSNVVVDFQEAFSYIQSQKRAQKEQTQVNHHEPGAVGNSTKAEWQPELKNIVGENLDSEFGDEKCTAECCQIPSETYHEDAYGETNRNRDYVQRLMPEGRDEPPPSIYIRPLREIKVQEEPLSDADYLVMSYRVFAFVLRSRKWAQLDLNHLRPPDTQSSKKVLRKGVSRRQARKQAINDEKRSARAEEGRHDDTDQETDPEDDTAFGQLVLPRGHKKMVKSLVAQHFRDRELKEEQRVDIVAGKGKGLIILLHGAPGVGKTTTAEGVAEKFKKPLYQITCGDLGTSAPEVEKALETSFNLASRWESVLLLDEADVFLAARSRVDFQRNGLVSVFLRILEYYTGVLFLTTNRIGDFDEAFASRIHVSLYYPQLDLDSTREIFELNLDMIESRLQENRSTNDLKGDIRIDRDEILQFAEDYFENPIHEKAKWNGRQIRNACQTALALAEFRAHERRTHKAGHAAWETAVHLKVKDLMTVADAYLEFINYLNSIRDGFDAHDWAKKLQIRAKETGAVDKKKGAHPSHKIDNNKQDAYIAPLYPQPPMPSATTETAAASSIPTSHQQRYGGGGGDGSGSGPVPPMAAAIPTAPQPIPSAQTIAGTVLPGASPLPYAQQGYYYAPHASGGVYGSSPPPQGAPQHMPYYQQQQQQQQQQYQQQQQHHHLYGGAPPPNTQPYYQPPQPPGPSQGQPLQPPPRT